MKQMIIFEVETDEKPHETVARIRRKLDWYSKLEFIAVHDGETVYSYPERNPVVEDKS